MIQITVIDSIIEQARYLLIARIVEMTMIQEHGTAYRVEYTDQIQRFHIIVCDLGSKFIREVCPVLGVGILYIHELISVPLAGRFFFLCESRSCFVMMRLYCEYQFCTMP